MSLHPIFEKILRTTLNIQPEAQPATKDNKNSSEVKVVSA
jgi:hypothetical protein